jgi:hypothetical protein
MNVKCIILEIALITSVPAFFTAAWYSTREIRDPPAAVHIKAGGTKQDTARREGALPSLARSPELVSRAFRMFPELEENPGDSPLEKEEPILPVEKGLKSLGLIRDGAGIERLYIKDPDTGTITAVRTDGTPEGGTSVVSVAEDLYVINLGGVLCSLRRE